MKVRNVLVSVLQWMRGALFSIGFWISYFLAELNMFTANQTIPSVFFSVVYKGISLEIFTSFPNKGGKFLAFTVLPVCFSSICKYLYVRYQLLWFLSFFGITLTHHWDLELIVLKSRDYITDLEAEEKQSSGIACLQISSEFKALCSTWSF